MTVQHEGRIGIRVYGVPIPQGSKTAVPGPGRRPQLKDANEDRLHPWRSLVRARTEDHCRYFETITGPVKVWLRFTFDRPRGHYRTGRNANLLRDSAPAYPGHSCGDIDKLTRAVLDAITKPRDGSWAGLLADDTQVVDIRARKFYAGEHELALDRAGVDVIVEPLPQTTAPAPGGEARAGAVQEVLL